MFLHTFKYTLKTIIRSKEALFWSFLFPIALSTFMFMAFGKVYETEELFEAVPVTVIETSSNELFMEILDSLSTGDDKLLDLHVLSEEEALTALEENEINGIIYVDKDISLKVSKNGYEETVLKVFLEQYVQTQSLIEEVVAKDPSKIQAAVDTLSADTKYYTEISTSDGNQNIYVTYFYAVLAMSCLFAAFNGLDRTFKIQADISALGQRRAVAPTKKMIVIFSEFLAGETVQFAVELSTLFYMSQILGIDFGNKYPAIILLLFLGSSFGMALGIFIGALPKLSEGSKLGITITTCMFFSVLADLCVAGLRDKIEHVAPIINKLNPAALIVDSFYSLNVFDTYNRFFQNMVLLGIFTLILCVLSILMIRRNRYASL